MNPCWEDMVALVLLMLSEHAITPEQAESWLWSLVEFAEATYD